MNHTFIVLAAILLRKNTGSQSKLVSIYSFLLKIIWRIQTKTESSLFEQKDINTEVSKAARKACAVLCSVSQLCPTLWKTIDCPARLLCPWDSPGKNTGVGCHALLQGIFPTQGSNPGLPHCWQILHQLSYQGCPARKTY